MTPLDFQFPEQPLLLCVGAHCDDVEIGCSGTMLSLKARHPELQIVWLVLRR